MTTKTRPRGRGPALRPKRRPISLTLDPDLLSWLQGAAAARELAVGTLARQILARGIRAEMHAAEAPTPAPIAPPAGEGRLA